ncbi:MAG: cobyrinate a,c-diamide synthase [Desulfobacterales bacterium]|nr:cobyrinate a,c-diamide synthase [Desulfobacterales bacterium]
MLESLNLQKNSTAQRNYTHPKISGIVVAGLKGGTGKTVISLGIIANWIAQGFNVSVFKKGPDYIDAGWLATAAKKPCYNLDTYLVSPEQILHSFFTHAELSDIAVIEGNRGLFDGIDIHGSTSTAEISKLLKQPVLLCLDCSKTTCTMAALVCGCKAFDPQVNICSIILNQVAGSRHTTILKNSIEYYSGIPVIGAIPKMNTQVFPERHMGLLPAQEHEWASNAITISAQTIKNNVDLNRLLEIAHNSNELTSKNKTDSSSIHIQSNPSQIDTQYDHQLIIGIAKDSAFQFYYPDNIEALEKLGAKIVYFSPLIHETIPNVDAVYIGGGFPETHAAILSNNVRMRSVFKQLVEQGMPIYAECGGLMYMGQTLVVNHIPYSMTGILPISFELKDKPQGHGYTSLQVDRDNPYFPVGTEIKGHEFRYSMVTDWHGTNSDLVCAMHRGVGIVNKRDGLVYQNVFASYTHVHALGTPCWATAIIQQAIKFKHNKKGQSIQSMPCPSFS